MSLARFLVERAARRFIESQQRGMRGELPVLVTTRNQVVREPEDELACHSPVRRGNQPDPLRREFWTEHWHIDHAQPPMTKQASGAHQDLSIGHDLRAWQVERRAAGER